MAKTTGNGSARAPRSKGGLSREVIIQAAIELLDAGGESALTLRALTVCLRTGYGAIYHHVADKGDLLSTATDEIFARVLTGAVTDTDPRATLRRLALGLFDAIGAHPWVAAELSRQPWRPALLDFYESIARLLDALDVPERARFDAAGTFMSYVLGEAVQNAANARHLADSGTDRAAFLDAAAARWAEVNPSTYPFVHAAAKQLRDHDDREQFLAGVDIVVAGIATLRQVY
ncbi:AcrR family transcriptional regulator [Streptomyces sp. B3I7]|uniref:TetR/AcrR family transcriptional regulator n=1 Tax=Streptomyces sp. B3I7 TaxID=3042269 RepID=UPI002782F6E6|nr:TetR/AcrR family transcriptional regulator C-terminal domain-containing protein [Streptomyces sp. B3I7]MDQ0808606.1 AcrR family transcriptional regulator [Streptomyces sp. B3I7]